jgi:hypothetical protein
MGLNIIWIIVKNCQNTKSCWQENLAAHGLSHWYHLAGIVSPPDSSTKPKSEGYARDQYHTSHDDVGTADQIMALSAASSFWWHGGSITTNNVLFTQKPIMQCLPSSLLMQLQRRELKFKSPLLHTNTTNRRPQATLNQPYYTLSMTYGHMVSESTGIVNICNYPAKRVCMTVIHGLSQISCDWTIRVSYGWKSSSRLWREI